MDGDASHAHPAAAAEHVADAGSTAHRQFNDPSNVDTLPGWGLFNQMSQTNEWQTIMLNLGVQKTAPELTRNDLLGKIFDSYELAETFYHLYSTAMGFGVRKGALRRNAGGEPRNRTWLCCKEGTREDKYLNLQNRVRVARGLTREGCNAKLRIIRKRRTGNWVVKEFHVEHTHPLALGAHVHFMRDKRNVSSGAHMTANRMRSSGVKTHQIMSYMADQVGGYNNVRFIVKDLYNKLGKQNDVHFADGDAEKSIGYLQSKADHDIGFFGKFTYDSHHRLENLMWADGRARLDYTKYGDVLSFDTTYKSNQYGKPLLVFVGVNNHFRSTIFAFAVLVNESIDTYKWALTTFLECMHGATPKTVITDGDLAMRAAIVELMPRTVHRLCSWHIEQNVISHVKAAGFLQVMKQFMFRQYSEDEFERRWEAVVDEYGRAKNKPLTTIYDKRQLWADTYLRKSFFGGMTTTQRCEKMNSFLKSKVMKEMQLCDFLRGMDMALSWLRHKQAEDEYNSFWKKPVINVISMRTLEAEAAEIYTTTMFYKVRDEMKREGKYIATSLEKTKEQISCCVSKYGHVSKKRLIICILPTMTFSCACNLFPSKGIPCRHVFAMLKAMHVNSFPKSLICDRWRKNQVNVPTEGGTRFLNSTNQLESHNLRFGHLTSKCSELAYLASQNNELFDTAVEGIQLLSSKMRGMMSDCRMGEDDPKSETAKTSTPLKNPKYGRTKGGWMGSRNGGAAKKQCSQCHRVGHNKATCMYKGSNPHKKSKLPREQEEAETSDTDIVIDLTNEDELLGGSAQNNAEGADNVESDDTYGDGGSDSAASAGLLYRIGKGWWRDSY